MLVTAMGDPQTAAHVMGTVLPFPYLKHTVLLLGTSPGAHSLALQALLGDPLPLPGVRGGDSGFSYWSQLPLGPPSRLFSL